MTAYAENHKESTKKKPLGLIKGFSKVAGYKVNMHKLIISLYAKKKKNVKMHINVIKYVQELYAENYEVLY